MGFLCLHNCDPIHPVGWPERRKRRLYHFDDIDRSFYATSTAQKGWEHLAPSLTLIAQVNNLQSP